MLSNTMKNFCSHHRHWQKKKKKGGIALPCALKCIIIIALCIKKKYISYAFEKINK